MTNFDFLQVDPQFESFADVAASAEQLLHIDTAASVLNCRRAMEFAIKWLYSAEQTLVLPPDDTLANLMDDSAFLHLVGSDFYRQMDFIRKLGNLAAHDDKEISTEQGKQCLENLFRFLDYVASRYGKSYRKPRFDETLLELTKEEALSFVTENTDEQVLNK